MTWDLVTMGPMGPKQAAWRFIYIYTVNILLIMVNIRILYDCYMVIIWLLYGYYMVIIWLILLVNINGYDDG